MTTTTGTNRNLVLAAIVFAVAMGVMFGLANTDAEAITA
jgi:hypothetical protein